MLEKAKKLNEAVKEFGLDVMDIEPKDLIHYMDFLEEKDKYVDVEELDPTEYARYLSPSELYHRKVRGEIDG